MRGRRKLVDIAAPQVGAADDQTSTLQRLATMFNRWQEDRSVLLANPCEPFDELKYRDPEGFVAARVLVEALRRAGPQLDTEKLVDALEGLRNLDLGLGTPVNYGRTEHQAVHKVWGTQLDGSGHFQAIDLQ